MYPPVLYGSGQIVKFAMRYIPSYGTEANLAPSVGRSLVLINLNCYVWYLACAPACYSIAGSALFSVLLCKCYDWKESGTHEGVSILCGIA